ncbi:acyl transferase domain-containing protein/NADPH:quinone reductase-like Zn-dependent oxidoreductase/NADP-dependent 3-hydroxy acid dehydrogenase YdfG/acyl carrier protein [Nocardia transvalensis]|uniref:Acyl transferase domain-containing protein/NADPH:quinone reductase-like Zn-dependent oxidoreductase/NADP-dependent 3-hydroxy acid dehydrogenase YdfG/acyl carrier protein n=1 Tax=Nocardia transvalensis TaxID=37333 RepID=A0A7W9PK12_9NOCA|nr:type I polyketide synthase [Nocardia transvalensis]MBB5917587.1 acyl transferase domain-containing protein/NADPH:quinone reductase-like Zn-dependent oxidoreductase/NADP-dependent 3-hydroxy acid dehydrogenase YdfG/acyl carrier protein [Nocardia transvalensis]
MTNPNAELVEALRAALVERDRLRRENSRLTARLDEPIAVVGMSCRFPGGVSTPAQWWDFLAAGRDGITAFPADRGWRDDALAERGDYPKVGGFLDGALDFDPDLFGISPREALATDPQQRLLLEASWEAIEDARIDPVSLRGSSTAVFAGVMYHDYADRLGAVPERVEGHLRTGSLGSVVSGRVAFALGLHGPAVTIDTACSSSLVAMHLAGHALRQRECSLALAGGVTVMSTPKVFAEFARQGGLAPDGRCKAFGAGADGTGWSEGVGVLVLERLSDARRLGHRVLALVRGSAVNSDGASNGLTAPNGPAQQRVIRQALATAGLRPEDIDVVEGHGTGTRLGDPVEIQALLDTYGPGRTRPLWLGSVKSNVGHTQAAAGVAGVIKTILAMRHGSVPPTLHADQPSPHVEWSEAPIRLATTPQPWPETGHPRRAAVSSFGISGTNAHVILEQAPEETTAANVSTLHPSNTPISRHAFGREPATTSTSTAPHHFPIAWPLSGRTPEALTAQAARLSEYLESHADPSAADIALSLTTTRSRFPHRAVLLGRDRTELAGRLTSFAADGPGVVRGEAAPKVKSAFLFPGQGSQRPGMGRELHASYPVFAETFDEITTLLDPKLERPLREIAWAAAGSPEAALLDRTDYTQAALFTVEVALYRLLESWGMTPDFLLGHSIGGVSAAYLAGVWSLTDAVTLVAARGRLMRDLPPGGAMLAVAAAEDAVADLLAPHRERVALAAVNGPAALVVSGDEDAVEEIAVRAAERGYTAKRLRVSHAFHSPRMRPMLAAFAEVCAGLTYRPPALAVVSDRTGRPAAPGELATPEYWVGHIADTVRFGDGVRWLLDTGRATVFTEVGPGAALSTLVAATADRAAAAPLWRPGSPEPEAVATGVAEAFVAGAAVDWSALVPDARVVDLPTYAFQHQRFWLAAAPRAQMRAAGLSEADHPLLGAVVAAPGDAVTVLTGRLSVQDHPWLADHRVGDRIVVPATVFVELALRAADEAGCSAVTELTVVSPLVLADEPAQVQVRVEPAGDGGGRAFTIHARFGEGPWTTHAEGGLDEETTLTTAAPAAPWPPAGAVELDPDELYRRLDSSGLHYGPAFRGLREVWRDGTDLLARVQLPDHLDASGFRVHPALLDAALHALAGLDSPGDDTLVPFAWHGISLAAQGATEVRVRLSATAPDHLAVEITDPAGGPVITAASIELRAMPRVSGTRSREPLYAVEWIPALEPATSAPVTIRFAGPHPGDPSSFRGNGSGPHPENDPSATNGFAQDPDTVVLIADIPATETTPSPPEAVRHHLTRIMAQLRDLLADDGDLVVVTRGATAPDPARDRPDLAGAAVWGLVRSAQTEYPDRIVLLDLDPEAPGDDLAAEVTRALALGEPQVAFRGDESFVPRLTRVAADATPDLLRGESWRLVVADRGTLDSVTMTHTEENRTALRPSEVRIAMRAAGVNFRDILIGLGMYPDPDAVLGGEGSGIVLEVGAEVTDIGPGDRVMGLFDGIGSTVVTDHRLVARIPAGWTFAQAAAVPVVFLTAYYALTDLAALRAGESVLVHAATGGVGTAAMQLARHWGAEIFATAGRGKWEVLRERGLDDDHIGDSRSLDFERHFATTTAGSGVDVVLDSLAGELVDGSLRLLPRGGRFVEMGVTDVRDPDTIAGQFPGVAYHSFLITQVDPDRIRRMLAELVVMFESRILTPPPLTTWDVREAITALRYVGQARHIGKVVLTWPPAVDPEGTALITGGTGMIGGAIARHLVAEYGIRHLVLASRTGESASGAAELADDLAASGARVRITACDTADRAAVTSLLQEIPAARPLTMVVHAAGTVDDALLTAQTPDRLDRVLRPKVDTAWHLHDLTRDADLAAFAVFSSAAGILGTPGQTNYAAANAFLDALAAHRHRHALPATSLAWGLWAERSSVSVHLGDRDIARMERGGFRTLTREQALTLFDASLRTSLPVTVPIRLDPAAVTDPPPLLRGLIRRHRTAATAAPTADFAARLAGRTAEEQHRLLLELLAHHVASVLDRGADRAFDGRQRFADLGFDSLTTVELRNQLRKSTGVTISPTAVFDYPTPIALAEHLRGRMDPPTAAGGLLAEVERALDRLIDSEVPRADLERLATKLTTALHHPDPTVDLIEIAGDDEIFDLIDRRSDGLPA